MYGKLCASDANEAQGTNLLAISLPVATEADEDVVEAAEARLSVTLCLPLEVREAEQQQAQTGHWAEPVQVVPPHHQSHRRWIN